MIYKVIVKFLVAAKPFLCSQKQFQKKIAIKIIKCLAYNVTQAQFFTERAKN